MYNNTCCKILGCPHFFRISTEKKKQILDFFKAKNMEYEAIDMFPKNMKRFCKLLHEEHPPKITCLNDSLKAQYTHLL